MSTRQERNPSSENPTQSLQFDTEAVGKYQKGERINRDTELVQLDRTRLLTPKGTLQIIRDLGIKHGDVIAIFRFRGKIPNYHLQIRRIKELNPKSPESEQEPNTSKSRKVTKNGGSR